MKNNSKRFILSTSLLAFLLASASALASPSGPYVVGEVGLGLITKGEINQLIPANSGSDVYLLPRLTSRSTLSERIAIGNYFSQPDSVTSIGIELGYNHLNQLNSNAGATIAGRAAEAALKTNAWSTTFEGIASFDVFTNTSFFAKLGLGYADITRSITLTNNPVPIYPDNDIQESSGLGIAGGAGFQFALGPNVAIRLEGDTFAGENNLSYTQGLAGLVVGFQM